MIVIQVLYGQSRGLGGHMLACSRDTMGVRIYEFFFCLFQSGWVHISSFAHSARPDRKVEMLGWSREGYHHHYFSFGLRIQWLEKRLLRSLL